MAWKASKWGLNWPFADKGTGNRHTAALFTLGCRRLPLLAAVTL